MMFTNVAGNPLTVFHDDTLGWVPQGVLIDDHGPENGLCIVVASNQVTILEVSPMPDSDALLMGSTKTELEKVLGDGPHRSSYSGDDGGYEPTVERIIAATLSFTAYYGFQKVGITYDKPCSLFNKINHPGSQPCPLCQNK